MIKPDCPCKRSDCERHGNCDACRKHHGEAKKTPPACERLEKKLLRKAEREEKHRERRDRHRAKDTSDSSDH